MRNKVIFKTIYTPTKSELFDRYDKFPKYVLRQFINKCINFKHGRTMCTNSLTLREFKMFLDIFENIKYCDFDINIKPETPTKAEICENYKYFPKNQIMAIINDVIDNFDYGLINRSKDVKVLTPSEYKAFLKEMDGIEDIKE